MGSSETVVIITGTLLSICILGYLFWRFLWFSRNPFRVVPPGENVVSPADGTVVYTERVGPLDGVLSIKNHRAIKITDIVRQDLKEVKLLIGIFMSPFDVHYNRAPLAGVVDLIRHHPAKTKNHCMGSMHWRSLLRRFPIYENSPHLVENERTVTKMTARFKDDSVSCYVVQIAGGSVRGVESYVSEGDPVDKGQIFGMIRIGSQVDLVMTWRPNMILRVRPGDKVKAGVTILIA